MSSSPLMKAVDGASKSVSKTADKALGRGEGGAKKLGGAIIVASVLGAFLWVAVGYARQAAKDNLSLSVVAAMEKGVPLFIFSAFVAVLFGMRIISMDKDNMGKIFLKVFGSLAVVMAASEGLITGLNAAINWAGSDYQLPQSSMPLFAPVARNANRNKNSNNAAAKKGAKKGAGAMTSSGNNKAGAGNNNAGAGNNNAAAGNNNAAAGTNAKNMM